MKSVINKLLIAILALFVFTSCAMVDSGHKGVEVEWGGKTNLEQVYPEGIHWGFQWIFDSMVEYDVRERTYTQKFEFNDKNNMLTGVEIAVDYNPIPAKVNKLHVEIADIMAKIEKTIKSAGKEVVPQYTASELNLTKRREAENKLTEVLDGEFKEFYHEFARVQLTDVDIPKTIADAAEATATQQERNELAKAKEAEAEANFNAAEWDAKRQEILSKPAMLELKKLELEEMWIKKWNGSFGNNNVFGGDATILKGNLK